MEQLVLVKDEHKEASVRMKQLDKADKVVIIKAANVYNDKRRSNSPETAKAYNDFLCTIEEMEKKTSLEILPQKELTQANALAEMIEIATIKATGEKQYLCNFDGVESLDKWLKLQNDDIYITKFSVTGGGGTSVKEIAIQFNVKETPSGIRYGACSEKKFRVFVGSNEEKAIRKFEEKNPDKKCVKYVKRKSGFSLIGGSVGFLRFVWENYVILYKQK